VDQLSEQEENGLDLLRKFSYYRRAYILSNGINCVFGKIILPFIKLSAIAGFVSSIFALLRMSHQMNFVSFAFTVNLAVVCVISLIPASMAMTNIYNMSLQFPRSLKEELLLLPEDVTRTCFKKQADSCSPIRCKIGIFYHMERKVKLILIDMLINGVVKLLLSN
jgi:hypothetical protein